MGLVGESYSHAEADPEQHLITYPHLAARISLSPMSFRRDSVAYHSLAPPAARTRPVTDDNYADFARTPTLGATAHKAWSEAPQLSGEPTRHAPARHSDRRRLVFGDL